MKQAVENGEVSVKTVGEDAVKVELKIAELDEPGTVAEKPKNPAVGDQAVELLVEIDELLHDGMSRHAEGSVFRLAVEAGRLAVADNLHRSLGSVDCPVRYCVDLAIELRTPDLELNLISTSS